jgi:hypothetical protein
MVFIAGLEPLITKTRFHSILEQLIENEIEKIKDEMATGIVDNLQYWRSVGTIEGLKGSLRLCDDMERDL